MFTTTATPKLTYNWVDITKEFTAMAKSKLQHVHLLCHRMCVLYILVIYLFSFLSSALNLGELLLDEHFGLYEAMSAVEMMDPKMDAGMMCNRSDKPTLTFEKGVEVRSD